MSDTRTPDSPALDAPWWARLFTKAAAPYAVVAVLILCAPGEQHLAQMAGWTSQLSWLYASLLAAYAGVSARIAVTRKPGDRGYRSAVVGAAVALLLAMAAQPVAHLFVTGWLSATPRTPVWLVIIVSSTPPLVLGHLLHFAGRPEAAGVRTTVADSIPDTVPDSWRIVPAQADKPRRPVSAAADKPRTPRRDTVTAPVGQPDTAVSAVADSPAPVLSAAGQDAEPLPDNVRAIGTDAPGLSALVRELFSAGLDEADVRAEVMDRLPDTKPDTLGKTIRRVRGAKHARTA